MPEEIQFIGYGIHTGPKQDNGEKIFLGIDNDSPTRLKSEERDFRARIELLKQAMLKAENSSSVRKEPLKIFTVPEFFFGGKNKGYTQKTFFGNSAEDTTSVLKALQDMMQDEKWKNWILVVGANLVYTTPSKKKELKVEDIKIPFFKPKDKASRSTIKKPVDTTNFTIVDAVHFTVLKKELQTAFNNRKGNITPHIDEDKIESLAEEVAYQLINNDETGYEDNINLRTVDSVASITNMLVKRILDRIKDKDDMEKFERDYGKIEWERALDFNKEQDLFTVALVIPGGASISQNEVTEEKSQKSEATANTIQIIMKPFYNQIAESNKDTEVKSKEQEVLNTFGITTEEDKDVFIDPWQLLYLDGTTNDDKITSITQNKKNAGSSILEKWNDVDINPTYFENINSTGIVKVNELTLAIDSGLDHLNKTKRNLIYKLNKWKHQELYDLILTEEGEKELYESVSDGVDIHVVASCGGQINGQASVAKKNGWIFNCDGYGNTPQSGSTHTGLTRVTGSGIIRNAESRLYHYGEIGKKETVQIIKTGIESIELDKERINVADLFWAGSLEGGITTTASEVLNVVEQGPVGGAIVIYKEVTIP